jgi:adenine deaminase
MQIKGNIVDIKNQKIFKGIVEIQDKIITSIKKDESVKESQYILPGFIDSHIHIESSMLTPCEFARIASLHGTVACVCDPHEIANVLGVEGVEFMVDNAKKVSMKFYFSCPTCVPATPFETSGAVLTLEEMERLLKRDEIKYMGEFMNFPGVISDDPIVRKKLELARKYQKPIDGHALV